MLAESLQWGDDYRRFFIQLIITKLNAFLS